jgi:hypothetical protein
MTDSKRKGRSSQGTENAPPAKKPRVRVSRACDQCRSAREKCDGIQPTCFTCASSNRDCSYTLNPKRRGIHRGYIRTLELTLAWAVGNVPNCDVALKGLLQDEKGQAMLSGADTAAVEKMHRKWRKTPVCKHIDRILSGPSDGPIEDLEVSPPEEDDDDDEDENIIPFNPEASLMTPESQHIDTREGYQQRKGTLSGRPRTAESLQQPADTQPSENLAGTLLVLPDNFWRLLDIYFAYTHSWLPIVEKEKILKICYSYPPEGLQIDPSAIGSGSHAELWSIFALAAFQDVPAARGPATETPEMLGAQMRKTARNLLPEDPSAFELGHVNSLIISILIDIGSRKFVPAWTTLGLAIRAASLHEPKDKGLVSDKSKATVLGCFILETFLAVELRKMPSFRRDQAMQIGFLDEEGMDEWQPWVGCEGFGTSAIDAGSAAKRSHSPMLAKSTFNQLVKLCYGINDHAVGQICNIQTNEEQYLYDWIQNFPKSFGPLHSLRVNESTPQRLNLFLAYLFTRAVCSPQSYSNAVDEALGVFDHYSSALGHPTMPPIFQLFLDTFQQCPSMDGLGQNRLAGIRSRLVKLWEPRSGAENVFSPSASSLFAVPAIISQSPDIHNRQTQHRRSITQDFHEQHEIPPNSLPDVLQQGNKPVFPNTSQTANSYPETLSPHNQLSSFPPATNTTHQPSYSSPYDNFDTSLDRYNAPMRSISGHPVGSTSGFTDLDAMFDDLTSFDGVDSGLQPQFMQNLGFAPNADLAEYMGFDVP